MNKNKTIQSLKKEIKDLKDTKKLLIKNQVQLLDAMIDLRRMIYFPWSNFDNPEDIWNSFENTKQKRLKEYKNKGQLLNENKRTNKTPKNTRSRT